VHSRSPYHRPGVDPLRGSADLDRDAARVDRRGARAFANSHAELVELLSDLPREPLTERGDDPLARVEQDHARVAGVDSAELALQGVGGDRQLTRDLHTRRPAADDDERQPFGARCRVVAALGLLEGTIEALAKVDRIRERLETARDVLPLVVAEVGGLRAARDDQAVVVEPVATVEDELAALGVDTRDLGHQERGVGAAFKRRADRRRALAGGQRARRDLIEERLEEVVVHAVDDRHVDVGVAELERSGKPAEPGADDHDPAALAGSGFRRHEWTPSPASPRPGVRGGGRRPGARWP
jgi:hypothetical protein